MWRSEGGMYLIEGVGERAARQVKKERLVGGALREGELCGCGEGELSPCTVNRCDTHRDSPPHRVAYEHRSRLDTMRASSFNHVFRQRARGERLRIAQRTLPVASQVECEGRVGPRGEGGEE